MLTSNKIYISFSIPAEVSHTTPHNILLLWLRLHTYSENIWNSHQDIITKINHTKRSTAASRLKYTTHV